MPWRDLENQTINPCICNSLYRHLFQINLYCLFVCLFVLCCQYLNNHMINFCRLWQILFPVLFHIAEDRTFWHWTSHYLYLLICTAYVNHFVYIASVYPHPLHLLFLEGFANHQQSVILLSPLFRYLYQIYIYI